MHWTDFPSVPIFSTTFFYPSLSFRAFYLWFFCRYIPHKSFLLLAIRIQFVAFPYFAFCRGAGAHAWYILLITPVLLFSHPFSQPHPFSSLDSFSPSSPFSHPLHHPMFLPSHAFPPTCLSISPILHSHCQTLTWHYLVCSNITKHRQGSGQVVDGTLEGGGRRNRHLFTIV